MSETESVMQEEDEFSENTEDEESNPDVEQPEETTESEDSETVDLSGVGKQEGFSNRSGNRTSSAWNISKIHDVVKQLKEQDDGSVRTLPIEWVWSNLRNSEAKLAWPGWSTRKQLLKAAEDLGISLTATEMGCKKYETHGQIEIKFS